MRIPSGPVDLKGSKLLIALLTLSLVMISSKSSIIPALQKGSAIWIHIAEKMVYCFFPRSCPRAIVVLDEASETNLGTGSICRPVNILNRPLRLTKQSPSATAETLEFRIPPGYLISDPVGSSWIIKRLMKATRQINAERYQLVIRERTLI